MDFSAVADIVLRTAVASMIGAAMLPSVAGAALRPSESRAERDHLRFYAELATAQDPAQSFPAPRSVPRISSRSANPIAEWMAKGRVHNIRFNSSFVREDHEIPRAPDASVLTPANGQISLAFLPLLGSYATLR